MSVIVVHTPNLDKFKFVVDREHAKGKRWKGGEKEDKDKISFSTYGSHTCIEIHKEDLCYSPLSYYQSVRCIIVTFENYQVRILSEEPDLFFGMILE